MILTYVGRMAPEKRLDLLMEAFPRIRARSTKRVALVFVGGGPALAGLQEEKLDGVHFAGYRRGEDLAAHYASSDVFLFPSDTETFGQVVTEAMASGLPVVAPDRGGVRDTVAPDETGYLFPPGDVDGLVDAASRLVDDAGLRTRLGTAGRDAALSRSWGGVFDGLFDDYAEAVTEADRSNERNGSVTGSTGKGAARGPRL